MRAGASHAWIGWTLAALLLAGCRAPGGAPGPTKPAAQAGDRPFYEGTAEMRTRAAEHIVRLDDERPESRMQASRDLARIGEPSVPLLLEALASGPSPRARGMAAYTLGFIKDHRARHPLAKSLEDADTSLRLESATALLRLGDVRGFAPLIAALEDSDALVRSRAIQVLTDATGDSLGFQPSEDPQERAAAVARWKGWLARRYETGP